MIKADRDREAEADPCAADEISSFGVLTGFRGMPELLM
jgi:hypothetical protein